MGESDLYYDPYDVEIDADPYPDVPQRLRDEAPLYYNERHEFWGLSRFADVEAALKDWRRLSSAKGDILEVVKADPVMPPGVFINEDPPLHTVHRALVSRAFTPKRINALEDEGARRSALRAWIRFVGADRFDFVVDLGAELPMRAIGMLLGIPDAEQPTVRDYAQRNAAQPARRTAAREEGPLLRQLDLRASTSSGGSRHPSDDLITELLHVEFEDVSGDDAAPDPGRAVDLPRGHRRCWRRHDRTPLRMDGQGARPSILTSAENWSRTARSSAMRSRSSCASSHPGRTSLVTSPRTSNTTARPCRRGARCSSCSRRRTATSAASKIRIGSTSTASRSARDLRLRRALLPRRRPRSHRGPNRPR